MKELFISAITQPLEVLVNTFACFCVWVFSCQLTEWHNLSTHNLKIEILVLNTPLIQLPIYLMGASQF